MDVAQQEPAQTGSKRRLHPPGLLSSVETVEHADHEQQRRQVERVEVEAEEGDRLRLPHIYRAYLPCFRPEARNPSEAGREADEQQGGDTRALIGYEGFDQPIDCS